MRTFSQSNKTTHMKTQKYARVMKENDITSNSLNNFHAAVCSEASQTVIDCKESFRMEIIMGQFVYVIKDEVGIHARPAGLLVKLVKETGVKVTVTKGDKTADATRLMALMGMGIKKGDEVTVSCEDDAVLETVKKFFEENL